MALAIFMSGMIMAKGTETTLLLYSVICSISFIK